MNIFGNQFFINNHHLLIKIYECLKEICDKLVIGEKTNEKIKQEKEKNEL